MNFSCMSTAETIAGYSSRVAGNDESTEPTADSVDGTRIYTTTPRTIVSMAQTVDELRNEIRRAVGRYDRVESTAFTKEALAALCATVNYDIDTTNLPAKPQMRAGILWKIGEVDDDNPDQTARPFRKAELEAIAAAVA
jgi:hypothetical protein